MNDAQAAMDRRLKQGWTKSDCSAQGIWFFPSERKLWQETARYSDAPDAARNDRAVIASHVDAIRLLESGCPKCLVGYRDIMSDPGFHCDVCEGTGFPVFGESGEDSR